MTADNSFEYHHKDGRIIHFVGLFEENKFVGSVIHRGRLLRKTVEIFSTAQEAADAAFAQFVKHL